jgi:hypothetical protein
MNLKITTFIADADIDIQNLWQDWNFLVGDAVISLVASTDEYTLASLSITDLVSWDLDKFYINPGTNNYHPLEKMKYEDWESSGDRLGVKVEAEPYKIVVKPDNSLVFIDVPDAVYTVWGKYYKQPTRLAINGDTSAIPTTFEMVIIYRAKMYYAEFYEHWDLYNSAEKDYMSELMKLEAVYLPEQSSRTRASNNTEDNRIVDV